VLRPQRTRSKHVTVAIIVPVLDGHKPSFVIYKDFMLDLIREATDTPSASGIAMSVGSLVSSGRIEPGQRLPTIRSLASHLGVSPNTVSEAWRILRAHSVITTDRRRGTTVRSTRGSLDGRYWRVPVTSGVFEIDLSTGTPDASLLPDLTAALRRLHVDLPVGSYLEAPVVADLEAELRRRWPFESEAMTIVDGAQDGLDRIVTSLIHMGDTVLIEDPSFPPLIDMLELAGARLIPIPVDADGVDPDAIKAHLDDDPVALFIQPRAHNPTGACLTHERAAAIAELIAGRPITVVEDDHSAAVSGTAVVSVGSHIDHQVIRIRSFSKSHGPDLRIAAMAGAGEPIRAIENRRRLGPAWTSRLIQHLLLAMLTDPETEARVAAAQTEYARRRNALTHALAGHDITPTTGQGLNLWVPVTDDQAAVWALAAHGIGVAPGEPFTIERPEVSHIRVTTGVLDEGFDRVADLIASVAGPQRLGAI